MTLTLTLSRPDCLTAGLAAGIVLIWIGVGLGLYGPWFTKNTEWLTLRPMTQTMRYGCLAAGEIILLMGALILAVMYHSDPARLTAALNHAVLSPVLGPVAALTLVAAPAAIPLGIIGIGWIFAFPSNLSRKVGSTSYAVHSRGKGPLPVVFPELTPRTRWWGARQWVYYNFP